MKPNIRKQQGILEENRKPYKKPKIERIKLESEEAVLGNCKINSDFGAGVGGCVLATVPCNTIGS